MRFTVEKPISKRGAWLVVDNRQPLLLDYLVARHESRLVARLHALWLNLVVW